MKHHSNVYLFITFPHLSIYLKNEQTLQKLKQWVQVTTSKVQQEESRWWGSWAGGPLSHSCSPAP